MQFRALQGRNPPLALRRRHLCLKFQGFVALAVVLRTVLESGVPLWLAVPNAMAKSLGLAGPPDVGDVPVEAPGPGCFQHRALAGAQATSQLQLVLHIRT